MRRSTKYYVIILLLLIPLVDAHGSAHRMRYTTGVQEGGIEGGIVTEGNFWGLCYRRYMAKRLGVEGGAAFYWGEVSEYTNYQSFTLKLSGVYHVTPLLANLLYFNVLSGLLFEVRDQGVSPYPHKNETHFNWVGMLGAELEWFVLERLVLRLGASAWHYFLSKGYDPYRTSLSVGIKWEL